MDFLQRTRVLYGDEAVKKFAGATVAVFGIGGVGSYAALSLIRCGIGTLIAVDRDVVDVTNINRQAVADINTVGEAKTDVFERMAALINPDANVIKYTHSFSNDFELVFDKYKVDAVADCIDDVQAKLNLICFCKQRNIPIISSMGTALRKRPDLLEITDIYKTAYDPLARVIRKELKNRGIKNLTVVCSKEEPQKKLYAELGSSAFVPAAAGLCISSAIIRHIASEFCL